MKFGILFTHVLEYHGAIHRAVVTCLGWNAIYHEL